MVFHWSLRDSKSPRVSRTPLSILIDLNNAVVSIVFPCPLISKSSSLLILYLGIFPITPINYYYYSLIRAFNISVSRWFFTGVWVTASLLKYPGLFSVYCHLDGLHPSANFQSSSPFSNPLVTVPNTPITIGIIVTCMFHSFFNSLAMSRYSSFFSHSFSFILWSVGTAKSTILQVLFFCWLLLSLVFWPRLGDPRVSRSPIGVYVCHFLGQVLGCAYTICLYGQI